MKSNYLIAIDSDGTLRHDDGTISEETKTIIKKIKGYGNYVVVCTARPRYHTKKVAKEINSDEYLISSNGTEIYDSINNKIIETFYLTNEECYTVYNLCNKKNIRAIFVTENTEYATKFVRNDEQILLDEQNLNEIYKKNIKQIMVIGPEKKEIIKLKQLLENKYKMNVIDSSNLEKEEIWFSIINKEASKGNAMIKLAKYLKVPFSKIVAIGNDNNDISMIKCSKYGVAVENATDKLKKVATIITDSNNNDGVCNFLNNFFANFNDK